eukprot:6166514-Amphidinium_carterae.1
MLQVTKTKVTCFNLMRAASEPTTSHVGESNPRSLVPLPPKRLDAAMGLDISGEARFEMAREMSVHFNLICSGCHLPCASKYCSNLGDCADGLVYSVRLTLAQQTNAQPILLGANLGSAIRLTLASYR